MGKKEQVSIWAIIANVLLAAGKLIAGFLAGSTAVFAEGIHSAMDILSSAISFIGIKISKKSVDKKHPYGYYKFEVIAGVIITIILFVTGLFILLEAWREFNNPSPVSVSFLVIGVMLISAIVNEVMARFKIYYGKKENSISLLSDGVHSRVDVFASIAVLIGLIISNYWIYIDSILAALIGLYIIKESLELGKEATDSLLDVSAEEEVENKIKHIVEKNKKELTDLKTQKKGSVITANLKIKFPKKTSVDEAVNFSEKIKKQLFAKVENLNYISVQFESQDVKTSYFKPEFGKEIKWKGQGPEGYCLCKKCGYKIKHQRGVPCSDLKCPKCKLNLTRENV